MEGLLFFKFYDVKVNCNKSFHFYNLTNNNSHTSISFLFVYQILHEVQLLTLKIIAVKCLLDTNAAKRSKKCSLSGSPVYYLYCVIYACFVNKQIHLYLYYWWHFRLFCLSRLLFLLHTVHKRICVQNILNIFPTLSHNTHKPIYI